MIIPKLRNHLMVRSSKDYTIDCIGLQGEGGQIGSTIVYVKNQMTLTLEEGFGYRRYSAHISNKNPNPGKFKQSEEGCNIKCRLRVVCTNDLPKK